MADSEPAVSYILLLEGGPAARPEALRALSMLSGGHPVRRVDSREAFEAALRAGHTALCIVGHAPADLDEETLHELAARLAPDVPVLVLASAELAARRRIETTKIALRELAMGVAHDLNNMFSVMGTSALMLSDALAPADPHRDHVAQILLATERARLITAQLTAFSRRQPILAELVDLSRHLTARRDSLGQHIGDGVDWSCEAPSDLFVCVDPIQLDEALLQLVLNAIDAMPRGGRLRLQAQLVVLSHPRNCTSGGLAPGRWVQVSLTDDGVGMSAEVVARVFEPFYSHARGGKGRGLGLTIVEGFALGAGGGIDIVSTPGRGTCITLCLPAVAPSVASSAD